MLERAAKDAYSWWWASHITTKQSKWLEQSLQDMEGKVQTALKLIEEDGDSFAKRAEMYYKKRPELISFVEESYRAYRALAERYDHISTELQNANNTIARVFPEKVQPSQKYSERVATNSGLNKSEAIEEIHKLQKEILALETMKEFVKSSCEDGMTKYWQIESQITELQDRVFSLEDEFKVRKAINDDEARTLVAEAALKSCKETLVLLQEKQEMSSEKARVEYKRIENAWEKLNSLKHKFLPNEKDDSGKKGEKPEEKPEEKMELDVLREKIAKHFEVGLEKPLTLTELAEKIDEVVATVISLETEVSSQNALIERLRTETDDLQAQIRSLEDEKLSLIDGTNILTNRLKEMEEKFKELQDLNQTFKSQSNHLHAQFTEARCSLDHLSEKLHCVKPDEELEHIESLEEDDKSSFGSRIPEDLEKQEDFLSPSDDTMNSKRFNDLTISNETEDEEISRLRSNYDSDSISEKREDPNSLEKVDNQSVSQTIDNVQNSETHEGTREKEDGLNWREMLLDGLEDREKFLLTEYMTILRNYKDLRKKLSEVERKKQDSLFKTTVQLRDLRNVIAKRDKEIQALRRKLNHSHQSFDENKDLKVVFYPNAKEVPLVEEEEEEDVKLILIDQPQSISATEEKLRMKIDGLLDENLDFWLRFSTSFHQIKKFRTGFQDLQAEIAKLEENEKLNQEGNAKVDIKYSLWKIYKHLRDQQTELTPWLEQSALLKEELQVRFSSLCNVQEEITKALKVGAEEEQMKFTSHEAAKFQGEVLNMKQENNKVRDELQAGLDHVTLLKQEYEKTLAKLKAKFGISGSNYDYKSQLKYSMSGSRVPLSSFIFGPKQKKKTSIFSMIYRRKHRDLRAG